MPSSTNPPAVPNTTSHYWPRDPSRFVLDNGLEVLVAQRGGSPVVELRFVFEGGFAADPRERSGLAGLAMAMVSEGALRVGAARLDVTQESLGAVFHGRVTADAAVIGMSALTANLADALAAYADVLSNPEFSAEEFERARANRLAAIDRERQSPLDLALRVLPPMLFGRGHPYARPLSGSGTEQSVAAITADELSEYYAAHLEVVRNELRQRESEPYGCAIRILEEIAHSPDHPYAHPPDGLVEELDYISTDDVREWIKTQHVAANAKVIIAGDVEPGEAIKKARYHFEAIAPRPAIARPAHPDTNGTRTSRRLIERAVKQARLYIAWNGPGFASPDHPALEVACEILAGGKSSRLWHRMVEAQRLSPEVTVELHPRELGSLIVLCIKANVGVPLNAIEAAVRRELDQLYGEGPSRHELDIARLRLFGRFVRGIERVGGPQSKSDTLGLATLVGGSPVLHERRISHIATTGPDAIVAAVRRWLAADGAILEIHAAA